MTTSSVVICWMTLGRARRVEVEVGVGQLGALGLAGRAGGVEDDRGVVVVALGGLRDRRRRPRRSRSTGPIGPHSMIRVPLFCAPLAASADEVGPHEDELGAGVGEEVVDLAGLEQRVHRHDDAAREQDAAVDDREGRHVGQDQRDPVAGLDPVGAQRPRDRRGHAVQLRVGHPLAVDPQRVLLGVRRCGAREVGREVGHRGSLVRRHWRRVHVRTRLGCGRGELADAWCRALRAPDAQEALRHPRGGHRVPALREGPLRPTAEGAGGV